MRFSYRMWFASLVSVSLSILLVFLLFRLWSTDLDIPFNNGIDALYAQVFINNLFASGWSNENARLGAPYGCDLKDFPLSEMAHLYLLQLLGLCKNHVGWAMNLFFLLSFPMAALTASITFCSLGIRWVPSIVCAVLFAFLPYHFARGEAHLFLSAYYFVPLTILVATWLHQGLLSCQRDQPWRVRLVLAVVICLLSSSGGIYYAFFGAFFILIGTVAGTITTRRYKTMLVGFLLVSVICGGVLLNVSRTLYFHYREGANPSVAQRNPNEAEFFALHISSLFLPREQHQVRLFSHFRNHFVNSFGLQTKNEIWASSIGIVGGTGLLAILGVLIFRPASTEGSPLLTTLGCQAICAILLGTIGGIGSLFAYLVSPQIRCYNRLSIFLAFLALCGVAVLLDRLLSSARGKWQLFGAYGLCVCVFFLGLIDQTSLADVPNYSANADAFSSMTEFCRTIEKTQPADGLIFQLPYISFPEQADLHQMGCYDHFRLFLQTNTLRYSHGAVRGRYGAEVFSVVSKLPPAELVDRLVQMGYTGLHVDRFGYEDKAVDLEHQLRRLLKVEPILSSNGRDLFFSLLPRLELIHACVPTQQWEQIQIRACYPLLPVWHRPFAAEESSSSSSWHWCNRQAGTVQIPNPSKFARSATISFRFTTRWPGVSHLHLSGLINDRLTLNSSLDVDRKVIVPPGGTWLGLEIDAKRSFTSSRFYFQVFDLKISEDPL